MISKKQINLNIPTSPGNLSQAYFLLEVLVWLAMFSMRPWDLVGVIILNTTTARIHAANILTSSTSFILFSLFLENSGNLTATKIWNHQKDFIYFTLYCCVAFLSMSSHGHHSQFTKNDALCRKIALWSKRHICKFPFSICKYQKSLHLTETKSVRLRSWQKLVHLLERNNYCFISSSSFNLSMCKLQPTWLEQKTNFSIKRIRFDFEIEL